MIAHPERMVVARSFQDLFLLWYALSSQGILRAFLEEIKRAFFKDKLVASEDLRSYFSILNGIAAIRGQKAITRSMS